MPTPATSDAVAEQDPEALVGTWWAEGDPSVDDALVALFPSGELVAYAPGPCRLMGTWRATESGLASMLISAAGGKCGDFLDAAYAFSPRIARFELNDNGVDFTDPQGAASLSLSPAPDPSEWPVGVDLAYVSAELEREYWGGSGTVALPEGVVAPTVEELTDGRWLPEGTESNDEWSDADRPHASFLASGRWRGSDGCNGLGGTWSLDEVTGQLLSSNGGQTEIGCNNVDVATMVALAVAVGLDGDELVFFGDDGAEIGRFLREGVRAEQASLVGSWGMSEIGESRGDLLVLVPGGRLVLIHPNCRYQGSWKATSDGLVAMQIDSGGGRDCAASWNEVERLMSAVKGWSQSDAPDGSSSRVTLTDVTGSPLATLGAVIDRENFVVSEALQDKLSSARPPVSPTPPDSGEVPSLDVLQQGTWQPLPEGSRPPSGRAFLVLTDTMWRGRDGCLGRRGSWSYDPTTGQVVGTASGIVPAIACIGRESVDVDGLMTSAAHLRMDGEELVFFDDKGDEIGRFVQES